MRLTRGFIRFRSRVWPRMNIRLEPQCPKCKYSLRGLAGAVQSRCPECGALLAQHHFTGLYRVRSLRAWVVTACGPMVLTACASALHLWSVRDRPIKVDHPSIVFIANAILFVTLFSLAITLAMAREVSRGCPASIRAINWGWATLSVFFLGITVLCSIFLIASIA